MAGCCYEQSLITALAGLFLLGDSDGRLIPDPANQRRTLVLAKASREVTDGSLGEAGNKFWDQ